ncbi:hypothetical protein GGR26_000213 [Lewinella marina]|uniref:Uncharacterized protein n=1 Tax=Neolewinella marina TaxID=438751 RepID=A0A2G0CK34_9BACT|nr:hypothetical protein [Neolewinella marina]NJB84468.1 hypothetical protein [Neolewinella marina]PHL00340.1 hypothetical protein CGL56_04720 [Neolewinella marina]
MKLLFLPLFFLALLRADGCDKSDAGTAPAVTDCGTEIQVRDPLPRLTSDAFSVVSATAEGSCLTVTISATGCSAQAWQLRLWTDGQVRESSPTQTSALLVFDDGVGENEMTCQAIIEESYRFDLTPYLEAGSRPTTLELTGTGTTVRID